ncbi:4400_t:CDS:1, partial [Dentiscutata heterogama]
LKIDRLACKKSSEGFGNVGDKQIFSATTILPQYMHLVMSRKWPVGK